MNRAHEKKHRYIISINTFRFCVFKLLCTIARERKMCVVFVYDKRKIFVVCGVVAFVYTLTAVFGGFVLLCEWWICELRPKMMNWCFGVVYACLLIILLRSNTMWLCDYFSNRLLLVRLVFFLYKRFIILLLGFRYACVNIC